MSDSLEERRTIELRGRSFVLTPLDLLDMQLLEKVGADMRENKITPREAIIKTAEIIFRSAQVAEPSLQCDEVKGHLTLKNFPRAMKALLQVSGLVADDEPAEKKTERALESTLEPSTAPTSPQPDGVSSK